MFLIMFIGIDILSNVELFGSTECMSQPGMIRRSPSEIETAMDWAVPICELFLNRQY